MASISTVILTMASVVLTHASSPVQQRDDQSCSSEIGTTDEGDALVQVVSRRTVPLPEVEIQHHGCDNASIIQNASVCEDAARALNKSWNSCCQHVDTLPYGCTMRQDGDIVFNKKHGKTYDFDDVSAICKVSETTTTTTTTVSETTTTTTTTVSETTTTTTTTGVVYYRLGTKGQDECPPYWERVVDIRECEEHASKHFPHQSYGGEECNAMKTKGCMDNGHAVYFNTCNTSQHTPSTFAPVCRRTYQQYILGEPGNNTCPEEGGYVRVVNETTCQNATTAEDFRDSPWGRVGCGFEGVSTGCFVHPFGGMTLYFRQKNCPESTAPVAGFAIQVVCMLPPRPPLASNTSNSSNDTGREAIQSLFHILDKDNNSYITKDEFAVMQ